MMSDGCGRVLNCGGCNFGQRCENNACYCANGDTQCLKDCTCLVQVDNEDDVCSYTFGGEDRACASDDDCTGNDICGRIISSRPYTCYRPMQAC